MGKLILDLTAVTMLNFWSVVPSNLKSYLLSVEILPEKEGEVGQ